MKTTSNAAPTIIPRINFFIWRCLWLFTIIEYSSLSSKRCLSYRVTILISEVRRNDVQGICHRRPLEKDLSSRPLPRQPRDHGNRGGERTHCTGALLPLR